MLEPYSLISVKHVYPRDLTMAATGRTPQWNLPKNIEARGQQKDVLPAETKNPWI